MENLKKESNSFNHYLTLGAKDKYWYEDCERLFTEIYGQEKLPLVTKLFAATSINTSLKSNVKLFRKALFQYSNGLPPDGYLPVIKMQLEKVFRGEELSGQKIRAFAAAMSGDINAVVVDTWLLRAFGRDRKYLRKESNTYRSGGASEKDFREIEAWVRMKAPDLDLHPRQLSAIIWTGVRIATNGDRQTHYKEVLKQQLFNMFENGS